MKGALGVVAMLVVAELACRVLPVSTASLMGYHVDPMIVTAPPGHRWWVSTGWDLRNPRQLSANNLGFVADQDFVPNGQALGLVGDSYVEASMLEPADRPAAQLSRRLPGHRPVYALGGPGSSLLDYVERMRFARQGLGLRDFVVMMEPGDVRQSLCGSGNVHAACLDAQTLRPRVQTLPGPSPAKRALRHSALAQYIVGQIKVDPARLARQAFASAEAAAPPRTAPPAPKALTPQQQVMVEAVAQEFFSRLQHLDLGRLVLVADGRRDGDTSQGSAPMLERDAFLTIARARGVTVVDAEPVFRTHHAVSALSLAVGPHDGHLNALGVGLLMDATAKACQ